MFNCRSGVRHLEFLLLVTLYCVPSGSVRFSFEDLPNDVYHKLYYSLFKQKSILNVVKSDETSVG